MFEEFYRLRDNPFRMTPGGQDSFRSRSYSQGLAYLRPALDRGAGVVMLYGAPGTGKTTLIRDLVRGCDGTVLELVTASLGAEELIELTASAMALEPDPVDPARTLHRVQRWLLIQGKKRQRVRLVLDEAHNLRPDALELVSWLVGGRRGGAFPIQLLLVGQEPLRELLEGPAGRDLRTALAADHRMQPLARTETARYCWHRLGACGWNRDPVITDEAMDLIYRYSRGVPRRINLIAGRLLLYGALEELHELDAAAARAVLQELDEESLLPAPLAGDAAAAP